MTMKLSDPSLDKRQGPMDLPPIEPAALVHYLTACKVAKIALTGMNAYEVRELISRLALLSIPDAVKLLREVQP